MEGKYFVGGCAILGITVIIASAHTNGINGSVTAAGLAAIVAIGSYAFGYNKGAKKET